MVDRVYKLATGECDEVFKGKNFKLGKERIWWGVGFRLCD